MSATTRVKRLRTRQGIMFQPICTCGAKLRPVWSRADAEQAATDHAHTESVAGRHHIVELVAA